MSTAVSLSSWHTLQRTLTPKCGRMYLVANLSVSLAREKVDTVMVVGVTGAQDEKTSVARACLDGRCALPVHDIDNGNILI